MSLEQLLAELDGVLTGKLPHELAATSSQQKHKSNDPIEFLATDGYYLSDGGYSRVLAREGDDDPSDCKLFLSGVSRDAVVGRWNIRESMALRRLIEMILCEAVKEHL